MSVKIRACSWMPAWAAAWPVLMLAAAGCSKQEAARPAPAPAEVSVLTVRSAEIPVAFEFVGQTESSQQVEIRARVEGFLERRVYLEGSVVKPGQKLFLMDSKPFAAQLQAAQGELQQQKARLVTARANLARVKPLAAQNALSQKDLDDATGQEEAAAAAVEAASAKVTDANLKLGYTTISSPVGGLSSFAKVQDGAYVNAQNNLLTYVAKLDPMRVNFSLSENELLRARGAIKDKTLKAAPRDNYVVEIQLADGSIFPYQGRITFADAAFNQETGTFLIRAEMPNPKSELRPGQFVRARLLGFTRPNTVVLPQRAIQTSPRGQFVWLVGKDGKAEQRTVEAGDWLGDNWMVQTGLSDGDKVVVDGVLKVAPGVPLKATEAAPIKIPSLATKAGASSAAPTTAGASVNESVGATK
jgi:membrane fusion protein (multidrug efflux system)